MDTTKELLVHETNGGAVYVTDNHRFTDAVTLIRIDNNRDTDPRATASELVRRWNSFPALVEVLKEAADLLYASMDEKQPGGSYGHDCHLAHRKAEELLNTL